MMEVDYDRAADANRPFRHDVEEAASSSVRKSTAVTKAQGKQCR
jgi:hypothetical protein